MKLRVATRGSKLSIAQTLLALESIKTVYPELEFEIVTIKTKGDILRDKPLYEIAEVGIFEKEVNQAVLRGEADIAVHSLKDLPSRFSDEMEVVYAPPRDSPHDALVSRRVGVKSPEELPEGAIVGTSSLRRIAQLRFFNDKLRIENIRGNLDTRLKKLESGAYDAIVVAEAGLLRLKVDVPYIRLPLVPFTPAPGQGIVAVVALKDSPIAKMLKNKADRATWSMMIAERSFVETLRAGCKTAVGAVSLYNENKLLMISCILAPDGSRGLWFKMKSDASEAEKLGASMAETVKSYMDKVLS
ncbi:MAG: hydroxymethylbilane synthase [Acidilobaceae archaeon]